MRTEVIRADTIDVAVEKILVKLQADTTNSGENVIYFDGWDGLGASAVLQGVADRLTISNEQSTRPTGPEFENIIYIDCSNWVNRRAVQREIAGQLKLPNWVIDMFDKQDEEDDFNGLDQISCSEIAQVVREIDQTTRNQRFLVILHNGGNEEIDIFKFGLSLYGYANSKMLWTFQGRFRLDPKMVDNVKKSATTNVLLLASSDGRDPQELWSYLVCQEATQICCNMHVHGIIDPAIAAKCVIYMLKQFWIGSHVIDYDWAVHTGNYWVCNGIITLADIDKAWQVGDVLQREVRLLNIHNRPNDELIIMPSSHQARSAEHMSYWISTGICGFVQNSSSVIPDNMFQHSQRLNVLKLSWCTFNFSSPPFMCCHGLRFLWLDHCQDLPTRSTIDRQHTDAYKEELDHSTTTSWECYQSLWVLDLRYTDCERILSAQMMDLMTQLRELNVMGAQNWDMSHLQGRVRNIRKLRVTKSTCCFNHDVLTEMESLELLDFSGNTITQGKKSLFGPTNNSSLETVIVGGCDGLKIISFRGCKELKNLLLKGSLGSLEEMELSGTSVKTLDLSGVEDRSFHKRIILLGCEKLRAILWPLNAKQNGWSKVLLHIDTTSPSTSPYRGEAPLSHANADQSLHQQKEEMFKDGWQISLTDTRLLRSLSHFKTYLDELYIHIDVGPAVNVGGGNIQGTRNDKLVQVHPHTSTILDSKYRDALKDGPIPAMLMWDCPKITSRKWTQRTCIVKVIVHGEGSKVLEDAPHDIICDCVRSLHVYDNPSIVSVCAPPQGIRWVRLKWCRVERCPKLHTVFTIPQNDWFFNFCDLETFWASQLQSARYIWDKAVRNTFQYLNFFHLDHCPRLVYVLCFSIWSGFTFTGLKTLEIVYCGDVREVFHLGPEHHKQDIILEFPKLRHIHLHELPMLQRIGGRWMSAPNLETIKIRGCWSLKHLPAIGRDTKPPKVDCEKEWWDNLEWDGLEKYHHPSLYEPSHSLYYKAQLPRGTVLR